MNTGERLLLADLIARPILFIIAVYNDAVARGRWVKIGRIPLEPALQQLPLQFIQDALNETTFSLYDNVTIRPAIQADCIGLERAAVWEPEHVEPRIADFYRGEANVWVEQLRLRQAPFKFTQMVVAVAELRETALTTGSMC